MAQRTRSGSRRSAPIKIESQAASPGAFDGYQDALKYLQDRVNVERTRPTRVDKDLFKLDRMRSLLAKLGDPQDLIRTIHIGGTKGKGSTCEMTASCLQACGYAVGLYTSPHLIDVRERIRLSGRMIPYAEFTQLMERIRDAEITLQPTQGELTFFEVMTAMALLWFAEQAVDVAVIEVGLGGRLDSTNVITPEVTAITQISLDHTHLLGDTVEKIAGEKAGIFKPGVPALTVKQPDGVLDVMRARAREVGAELAVVGEDIDFSIRFEASPALGPHARVCLTTAHNAYEHIAVPLKGEHQALNCGLALAILDRLTHRGFKAPESRVSEGLEATPVHGRLEIVSQSPRVLLDVAHNPASIGALMRAIGAHVPYDSLVVIFGCSSDKDVNGMLKEIAMGADKVIFTQATGNPRATDPVRLQKRFAEISHKMTQTAANLEEALALAGRAVNRDDLICVTGSFYLVGEARKRLLSVAKRRGA